MTSRPNFTLDIMTYGALLSTIALAISSYISALASLTGILFPAAALLTGTLLLWRKPGLYISFMWWTWFLTPEVRRLVDYRSGYDEQSIVMLAPFLVSGVALIAVLAKLPRLALPYRIPLALVSLGLLYAYIIGVLNNGLMGATFDLLSWGTPVILGAYLLTHPSLATVFQRSTQQAFMWGLLLMGLYAIVQYFYLPPWDAYWMTQADMASIGTPEPQNVRVFSTLNSPGPFASVIMTGLLLAFSRGGSAHIFGVAAGFVGFALSAVRSAWGGWLLGLVILLTRLPLRQQAQLLGTLIVLAGVGIPLFTQGPLAQLLSQRLASVTNLQSDTSYNERVQLYLGFSSFTANNPLGQGLGSTGIASNLGSQQTSLQNLDSGVIAVLYTFGILGTLYFVGGAMSIFIRAILTNIQHQGIDSAIYVSITVGMLAQLVFGNVWSGVTGVMLWFFPCLLLASQHIHTQRKQQPVLLTAPVRVFKL